MFRYFAEFNRVVGDDIRRAARALRRHGLGVRVLSHRTSLEIERPNHISWSEFKSIIIAQLQPRRGSVMMSSEKTGNTFICNNASNRPGYFERQ